MKLQGLFVKIAVGAIAAALVKIAFFSPAGIDLIPSAVAQSAGVIEWKESRRIVTVGNDGATTYVWDYDEKTKVRKYTVKGTKMTLETFKLDD